jgi:hypothetical protein
MTESEDAAGGSTDPWARIAATLRVAPGGADESDSVRIACAAPQNGSAPLGVPAGAP